MLRPWLIPAVVAIVATAGIAYAQSPSSPAPLTADQYVQARQAAYDLSAATMAEMRQAVKDGLPVKKQAYPAAALGRWARVLPTLFPAGTGSGSATVTTHAKAEVWSQRAGFEKAASDYAAAADKLRDLAQADDSSGFAAQLEALDKTCDACHNTYKAK